MYVPWSLLLYQAQHNIDSPFAYTQNFCLVKNSFPTVTTVYPKHRGKTLGTKGQEMVGTKEKKTTLIILHDELLILLIQSVTLFEHKVKYPGSMAQ